MAPAQPRRDLDMTQERLLARLQRMGLSVRAMADGRSLIVTLPLGPAPFESVSKPMTFGRVIFSTVGADKIKCLRPRALFGLPLIDVRRCPNPAAIEARIREAWRERTQALRATRKALHGLGVHAELLDEESAVAFPLPGESPSAQVLMSSEDRAMLPSRGPLSGLTLENRDQRVLDVRPWLDSAADLECGLGQRIGELVERGRRLEAENRYQSQSEIVEMRQVAGTPAGVAERHRPKVLIVGPALATDSALREELERQGYQTATTHSEAEALMRLASMSPELIISEYALGRSDGASFVQSMRGLAGIERIPVLLVDEKHHDARRDAARAVGASGYLIAPLAPDRFVERLGKLVENPGKRRFTRYHHNLTARLAGMPHNCVVTEVGRGGLFLATPDAVPTNAPMRCELVLPELGRELKFQAEVLYCGESRGSTQHGLGLRFFDISPEDEAALIEYVGWLDANTRS